MNNVHLSAEDEGIEIDKDSFIVHVTILRNRNKLRQQDI